MIIKELFILGYKNFIRNKKNILNVLLISITFSLCIFCFSFKASLNDYWNNSVKKLVDYRTYLINYNTDKYTLDQAIQKLSNYKNVVSVTDEASYLISMRVRDKKLPKNNSILLVGTIPEPIKLTYGKYFDNSSKENQIICAKQFYPYFEKYQKDYLTSKAIDITDKLGKNIELSFIDSDEKEQFRVIGLYDAKLNHTEGNVCYTTFNVVNRLNRKYQYDAYFNESTGFNGIYATIDSIDHQTDFEKSIQEDGFNIMSPVLHINKDMGNNIMNVMALILIIVVILYIFIAIMLSKHKLEQRKIDFSIMKASGYKNKHIAILYYFEILFEFIIAFILSLIISYVFTTSFEAFYLCNKIMFYNLKINISYKYIVFIFISSILIPVVFSVLLNYKINKNTINKLGKSK